MPEHIPEIKMPTDIPTTMAAVLLTGHGGIEMLEYREDVAVPVPGPDEVLIRVGAAGVNNTDINTRTGWYSKSVTGATESGGAGGFDQIDDADASWSGVPLQLPVGVSWLWVRKSIPCASASGCWCAPCSATRCATGPSPPRRSAQNSTAPSPNT
jgi:hypothetical protein